MKPKGRPKKTRLIKAEPGVVQFSPRGRAGRPDEVELSVEEFEALRLGDYKNTNHKLAGTFMGVSRQTFERILKKARNKVADGLINGKIIRIQGGQFKVG